MRKRVEEYNISYDGHKRDFDRQFFKRKEEQQGIKFIFRYINLQPSATQFYITKINVETSER